MGQHGVPAFLVGWGVMMDSVGSLPSQCGGQTWDSIGSLPSLWSQMQRVQNALLLSLETAEHNFLQLAFRSDKQKEVWSSQSHSPAHHPCLKAPPPHSHPEDTQTWGDQGIGQHTLDHHLVPSSQALLDKGTKLMSRALKGLTPLCMTPAEKASG